MKSRARQQPSAKPSLGRTAVVYVRVSSKEQEQGFSIPAQRQLLSEYAQREGIHVVQEFEDVETAKRAGRTSFGEMVAFLRKQSSCRILLVEKTDRLYRNIKDYCITDNTRRSSRAIFSPECRTCLPPRTILATRSASTHSPGS